MNTSDVMVERLASAGVKYVFGLPGHSILDLADAIVRNGSIKFITVRHEQVAAAMADGYARVTGKPGVCMGAAGPGSANLIIGVATAYKVSIPVLAITANVDLAKAGRDAFNEWDQMSMFKPVTKMSVRIERPELAGAMVDSALIATVTGRPGPVHIDLPEDIAYAEVKQSPKRGSVTLKRTRLSADSEQVDRFLRVIKESEKPVLLVGGGAVSSEAAPSLREFVEALTIPVATSTLSRGTLPEDHPLSFGATGIWGFNACKELIRSSDLIISLAFKFSNGTTSNWTLIPPDSRIVQVDIDPGEIGRQYPVELGIVADIDTFLRQVLASMKHGQHAVGRKWAGETLKRFQEAYAREREQFLQGIVEGSPVDPRVVARDIINLCRPDVYVTAGAGLHARFMKRLIMREPRHFLRSGNFGCMGFAFPAALGAKIANPQSQVVCVDGDGDFMMVMQDLETAVRHRLNVVTVVFNDSYYAAEVFPRHKGRDVCIEFNNPNFAKLAESFGAEGFTVTRTGDFSDAFKRALNASTPALIDVHVNRDLLQKFVGHATLG